MSYSVGYQSVGGGGGGSIRSQQTSGGGGNESSVMSMDEAYRRLGHKLSQRVTSGENYRAHVAFNLGTHPCSAFTNSTNGDADQASTTSQSMSSLHEQLQQRHDNYHQQHQSSLPPTAASANNELWNRSHKVAKMGYLDHGSHTRDQQQQQQPPNRISEHSILKKLTYHCKSTFRAMEATKHSSTSLLSNNNNNNKSPEKGKKRISPCSDLTSPDMNSSIHKGFLESALETGDQPPLSLSSSNKPAKNASSVVRKCLTAPADPVSNNGRDNSEGNLIVHQGDWIVPQNVQALRKATSTTTGPNQLPPSSSPPPPLGRLQVVDLLGQGTFAQVFLCNVMDTDGTGDGTGTGEQIALKVVKNKQAYTRQAAIEIDVFRALTDSKVNMVQLQGYFMHQNHLCLVFELLGLNLYEVLKRRQFRGLPLHIVQSLLQQAMDGVRDLSAKSIVHCDLKPENILLSSKEDYVIQAGDGGGGSSVGGSSKDSGSGGGTRETTTETISESSNPSPPQIKLIDFGSACFEGHTAHTYIQSRFYRSPEVLVGLPYDSAIDMWSLGCVAAELFLGLPILPGVHEHDQLGRISEMIAPLPDWMLDQGSKSQKYFSKKFATNTPDSTSKFSSSDSTSLPTSSGWRIKTQQEYIHSLSASEIRKKGGLAKLEKQPTNRYFKRKKLADIVMLHGTVTAHEDEAQLELFVHFLLGILDPDPWKRWTAFQASSHPFVAGAAKASSSSGGDDSDVRSEEGGMNNNNAGGVVPSEQQRLREVIDWVPPWDPSICRRKLLNVQKTREKQQAMRRGYRHSDDDRLRRGSDNTTPTVVGFSASTMTSKATTTTEQMSRHNRGGSGSDTTPPPSLLGISVGPQSSALHAASASSSMGSVLGQQHQQMETRGLAAAMGPQSLDYDYRQPHQLGDPNIPASLMMSSGGATGMSYGAVSMGRSSMQPIIHGAQSFSGMSHDSGQRPDSEFGYALQRPGVVPSTHGDAGSLSSMTQGSVSSMMSQNQLHHPPSHVACRSLPGMGHVGHSGRNATVPLTSGNRVRGSGRRQSYHHHLSAMSPGQSAYSSMYHHHPTSIREDASDYQLGGGGGDASSVASGASLLAQQLEDQAAIARDALRGGGSDGVAIATMDALQAQQQQQHLHQQQHRYAQQQQMFHPGGGSAGGGYYTTTTTTTYIAADGTPLVASSMDHLQSSNNNVYANNYHQHPGNFSADPRMTMQQQQMQQQHQQHYVQAPATLHQGGMGQQYTTQQHHAHHGYLQQQQQPQRGTLEELERMRQNRAAAQSSAAYRGLSM